MMEKWFCLGCFYSWRPRSEELRDWKRKRCPRCGKYQTIKESIYERAVVAFVESLESSPPPYPPLPSSVLSYLDVISGTLPDPTLPPRVLAKIYRDAKQRLADRGKLENT